MKRLCAPFVVAILFAAPSPIVWQPVTIWQNVTVNMPCIPADTVINEMSVAKSCRMEGNMKLFAGIFDFTQYGVTEEFLKASSTMPVFQQQLTEGIVKDYPGTKVLSNVAGKYEDKYVMYDVLVQREDAEFKGTVQYRMVFGKTYVVTLIYYPGNNAEDAGLRDTFYNSLKIIDE